MELMGWLVGWPLRCCHLRMETHPLARVSPRNGGKWWMGFRSPYFHSMGKITDPFYWLFPFSSSDSPNFGKILGLSFQEEEICQCLVRGDNKPCRTQSYLILFWKSSTIQGAFDDWTHETHHCNQCDQPKTRRKVILSCPPIIPILFNNHSSPPLNFDEVIPRCTFLP